MNVLQIISTNGCYGAENMVLNLSRALADAGCGVKLCTIRNSRQPNQDLADRAREAGLGVEIVDCRGRFDPSAAASLRRQARQGEAAVIHTHGYKADLYGYAVSRGLPARLVATCHNWTDETESLRWYARLDRALLRRFDAVASVSDAVKEALVKARVRPSRIATVPNGIDTARFRSRTAAASSRGPRIGMVGRLVPEKGFADVLRIAPSVLAEFPDAEFLIAGSGPQQEELQRLAAELRIASNVVFAGVCSDMPAVYSSLDMLVLPSYNEGWPMTVIEAMAAGKPVVATRVGGVPDAVEDGRTGILVTAGDAPAIATALKQLLGAPETAARMGRAGAERAEAAFSASRMAARYLDLYGSVCCQ